MKNAGQGQGIIELLLVFGLLVLVGVFALPGLQGAITSAFSTLSSALNINTPAKPALTNILSYKAPSSAPIDWGEAANAPSSEDPQSALNVPPQEMEALISQLNVLQVKLKEAQIANDYTEVAGDYGQLAQQTLAMTKMLEEQAQQLNANDPDLASLQEVVLYGKVLAGSQAKFAAELFLIKGDPYDPRRTPADALSSKIADEKLTTELGLFQPSCCDGYDTYDAAMSGLPIALMETATKFESLYQKASSKMLTKGYLQGEKDITDKAANKIIDKADIATTENALSTLDQVKVIDSVQKP